MPLALPEFLLVIFPLFPFLFIMLSLFSYYVVRKDLSFYAVIFSVFSQVLTGLSIAWFFRGQYSAVYVPLSYLDFSIVFRMDGYKTYFLLAFMTPCILFFFNAKIFTSFHARIIFLFYLAGCSGVIVTGDMFNFFVFYEIMIMAAYVLISINEDYYAGIKYMFFGAFSSVFFLAGIILWFSMGEYFSFTNLANMAVYNEKISAVLLILFSSAFFIKSGFFPVSSWPATCHAATNKVVSTFLSSFTIFSGIYGLLYLVVLPAQQADLQFVFPMLRIISVATILSSSFFLVFEVNFKRCIAGSTVFSIGFVGLCFSYFLIELGLTYMLIHSVYKSLFFLLYDKLSLRQKPILKSLSSHRLFLQTDAISFFALYVCIFFTAGFFPALTYFIKNSIYETAPWMLYVFYPAMIMILASFLKFSITLQKNTRNLQNRLENLLFYTLIILLLYFRYHSFPHYIIKDWEFLLFDFGVFFILVILVFLMSKQKSSRIFSSLSSIDRKYLFINLNLELFFALVLLFFQLAFFYISTEAFAVFIATK